MTARLYSNADKLAAVESVIEMLRWARDDDTVIEHDIWLKLKATAADLRARLDEAPGRTLDALAFQVNSALRAKARVGYIDVGHQQAIAEAFIAHWPVVSHALEKVGEQG